MERRRFRISLMALWLLMAPVGAWAQSYTVYSVVGTVKIIQGQKQEALRARKLLSASTLLSIGEESAVTILDEKGSKMYSLTSPGRRTVKELIGMASDKQKSLSKQYMSYLVKQLFADGSQRMSHPDTYMQATATSYRSSASDSLLLTSIVRALPQDGLHAVEQLLCSEAETLATAKDVSFELVDCDTRQPLTATTRANTPCYVRVSNNTQELLYVNLLNIDGKGQKYLVLPVDEAGTCAHLLVPPMSTVAFQQEPFIFADGQSVEAFLLVATESPVDFSILMSPIRSSGTQTLPVGLNRKIYQVQ